MTDTAAIALFLYRRPEPAARVVDALRANPLARASDLYVFCDGPKHDDERERVDRVRTFARRIDGFRTVTVRESPHNRGLSASIIDGVSRVLAAHRRVVIVEDDVLLSARALDYFNAMLERFEKETAVASIAGFSYPPDVLRLPRDYPYDVFFTPRLQCWGWATWRDRWNDVDWSAPGAAGVLDSWRQSLAFCAGGDDMAWLLKLQLEGRIDSWAIRWDYHQFRRGAVCVHPCHSYATRIDTDDATHGAAVLPSPAQSSLCVAESWRVPERIALDRDINRAYKSVYDRVAPRSAQRLLSPGYWRRLIERRIRGV